jgi:hypothetical protein
VEDGHGRMKRSVGAIGPQWTRHDVPEFLNDFFQGAVTPSQLIGETRRRFPDHKPLLHREVDRYVEVFLLDVLRIVTAGNVVDALLAAQTPHGPLGNLTRP